MIMCAGCGRILLDSTSDGGYKLRSRMVLFNSTGQAEAIAICPTCKHKVPVPLTLGDPGGALPKDKLFVKTCV